MGGDPFDPLYIKVIGAVLAIAFLVWMGIEAVNGWDDDKPGDGTTIEQPYEPFK